MAERTDWAVILARGESRRMGRAKGLCTLPGDTRCFLQRIADLYHGERFDVAVVCTPELAREYTVAVGDRTADRWLTGPPGAGTAQTVVIALRALSQQASHLWLHPVDLPVVDRTTIADLYARSRAADGAVLVPEYDSRPGHPVVLPVDPFRGLARQRLSGAMRDVLRTHCIASEAPLAILQRVPVPDVGVVDDYDDPRSIRRRE